MAVVGGGTCGPGLGRAGRGVVAGMQGHAPPLPPYPSAPWKIFEYDELEFQIRPNPRDHMVNVWGYSHVSFFAPMARFGSGCGVAAPDAPGARAAAAARELKDAVKALHAAGIKVILDVVYNHTAEGKQEAKHGASMAVFGG